MRTRVGYAGGKRRAPTYYKMGDHTETIQIDFDPGQITYDELLAIFWSSHDPTRQGHVQYRSIVLTEGAAQAKAVEISRAAIERKLGKTVATVVAPLGTFTRAEDYHQKYTLRNWKNVSADLLRAYPNAQDFTDSTAAARLNGYLAGRGDLARLEQDLPRLGLSAEAAAVVRERVQKLNR